MSQTWWGSIVEAKTNILIGAVVAYLTNLAVLPLFGFHELNPVSNLGITLIYTAVSIVRQLVIRRWANTWKWSHK